MHNNASPTCMTIIDPAIGWFNIIEIPTFDLNELALGNDEYINKSYSRVSQLYNNTWICRYPCTHKVTFDNKSDFNRDFTPLLKDFDIKPVLMSIKTSS